MKIDPVKYYFRDPETGVEMEFTKSDMWGWTVSFPNLSITESLDYDGHIPWPTLCEAEQKIVDANYERLRKACEEDEDK